MRKLRVAYGRIMQETNALSPVATTLEDFQRAHLVRGPTLARSLARDRAEVPGLYRNVELSGLARAAERFSSARVELVPTLSAWAVSGGPLTRATYDALEGELLESLRAAGPVDGVVLAQHGAMGVAGLQDPEARLAVRVREVTGAPVASTFDLHGNLTRERVASLDVLAAYRTNPHRDHARTGARAGTLLFRALTGEVRLETAWRSLPMLLGGGNTIDFLPPMRGVWRRVRRWLHEPGVLDVSLFPVHPWIAHPEVGWGVLVHADGDRALAERAADDLAEHCWAVRGALPPDFVDAREAVRVARAATLARRLGAVLLADASDVVTAGSVGESTVLLRELVERGQGLCSYVPIRDAEVVEFMQDTPIGSAVRVELGGKLDPARTRALPVEGILRARFEGGPFGRALVLDVGTVRVVVTEGAPMFLKPALFRDVGLEPWRADVIVVKNFFPFRMFYAPLARRTVYVKTGGITDFDAALTLPSAGPVHPREHVASWREADARRRGLTPQRG